MIGVTSITLDGWKGVNRTYQLGQCNLITGDNGSGKSAIITAIRWACTGETDIGKDLESVLKYCAADGASVTVTLSDGFEWTRAVTRGVRGKNNSETVTIAGKKDTTSTTAKVLIAERIGDIAEAWGESFLAESAEEKRDRIVDLGGRHDRRNGNGTSRDPDRLLRDITLQFVAQQVGSETVKLFLETRECRVDNATDEAIQALAEKYASPDDLDIIRRTLKELSAEVREDVSETINAVLAKSEDLEKRYARDAKQGELTAEGIAKRKAGVVLVGTDAASLRSQLDAAMADEKAVIAEKAKAAEQAKHAATLSATIAACDASLAQAGRDLATLADHPAAMPEDAPNLTAAAEAKDAEIVTARNRVSADEDRMARVQQAATEAAEALATARAQADTRKRLRYQIDADMAELHRLEDAVGEGTLTAEDVRARIAVLESVKLPSADDVYRLGQLVSAVRDEAATRSGDLLRLSIQADGVDAAIQSIKQGPCGRMMGFIGLIDPHVGPAGREPWANLCGIVADNVAASNIVILEAKARTLRGEIDRQTKLWEAAEQTKQQQEAELADAHKRLGEENEDYAIAQMELRKLRERAAAMTSWTEAGQRVHAAKTALLAMGDAPDIAALEAEYLRRSADLDNLAAGLKARQAEIDRLTAEAVELRQQAIEAQAAIRRDEERKVALEREQTDTTRERDEASAKLSALGTVEPLDELECRHAVLKVHLSNLTSKLTARQRWETIDAEYKAAIATAEAHKRGHEIAKGFSAAIRMVREAMMHAITAPLSSLMDRFFAGAEDGLSSFVTIDNDPGRKRLIFNMGWARTSGRMFGPESPVMTGGMVDQAAMSRGERPLFLAALAAALVVLADPPVRLLMLDAGGALATNLRPLLRGIHARRDDFSTVIVEVPEDDEYPLPSLPLDGWNVIDMTAAAEAGTPCDSAAA